MTHQTDEICPFSTVWKFLKGAKNNTDFLAAMREIEYCNVDSDIRNAAYNLRCCVNARQEEWRDRAMYYLVRMWNMKSKRQKVVSFDEYLGPMQLAREEADFLAEKLKEQMGHVKMPEGYDIESYKQQMTQVLFECNVHSERMGSNIKAGRKPI